MSRATYQMRSGLPLPHSRTLSGQRWKGERRGGTRKKECMGGREQAAQPMDGPALLVALFYFDREAAFATKAAPW